MIDQGGWFRREVLAVGPGEGLVTGQSAAFLAYARHSRHRVYTVNTNDEGTSFFGHVLSSIRVILLSSYELLLRRPDCIYISTSRSKLGAIKDICVIGLARILRIPVVNHLHGVNFKGFRASLGALYGSILDWAYEHISVAIVLHEKLISQYDRYPDTAVRVVENFVASDLPTGFGGKDADYSRINVLFMSNMIPEKGIFELIDAAKQVTAEDSARIRLRIAGRFLPGERLTAKEVESELRRRIRGCEQIEYCGFADRHAKQALLSWAHVLALPSYMKEEAVPLALLEGMAAGCYLIVSDFGVLPFLVEEVAGAVVPVKDAGALKDALAAITQNPGLLRHANEHNPRVARRRYSQSRYVGDIDNIVEGCAATNRVKR